MNKVRALVLRAPGTNCDEEAAFAFEQAGAVVNLTHISQIISHTEELKNYQIMVIPGGFTYGDDMGAGKIMANEIRLKLGHDIERFVSSGRLILGICNGFQVLAKTGILSGLSPTGKPLLTLTTNDSGRFECQWVYLKANKKSRCVFTQGIERLYLPVAHGEGKVVAEAEILPNLDVPLYYTDEQNNTSAGYPHNPNGSINNIAGICDVTGRIFALMPHPERFIRGTQHPRWQSEGIKEPGDGFKIFTNAVKWAENL
ncbi:MAG: phosphoribosylformylglycinamidine synthase I [Dehalococcoidales bacterium]|jgi:phosphoribosylformylglycinamidine synthase|nr:phosphoribosylformylglycinamidine synthase I [Dehalococcoidales bacterium]